MKKYSCYFAVVLPLKIIDEECKKHESLIITASLSKPTCDQVNKMNSFIGLCARLKQMAGMTQLSSWHVMLLVLMNAIIVANGWTGEGMICSSVPATEPQLDSLHFGCYCRERYADETFSLAEFAAHLSDTISNRDMVVSLRDCGSLTLLLDQESLYNSDSNNFRPDLQFTHIYIENIVEAYLRGGMQDPIHGVTGTPSVRVDVGPLLSVTLYDVKRVAVAPTAYMDVLETIWPGTQLQLDLRNSSVADIKLNGFRQENMMVLTNANRVGFTQEGVYQHVLSLMDARVSQSSRQMSLVLGVSLCLALMGAMIVLLVTVRRYQAVLKAVINSSLGSLKPPSLLKRERDSATSSGKTSPSSNLTTSTTTTTTTKVNFFPKYSVVNEKEQQNKEKKRLRPAKVKPGQSGSSKTDRRYIMKSKKTKRETLSGARGGARKHEARGSSRSARAKKHDSKRGHRRGSRSESRGRSSFYYQNGSQKSSESQKYDLTGKGAGQLLATQAQVHRVSTPQYSVITPAQPADPSLVTAKFAAGAADNARQLEVLSGITSLQSTDRKYSFMAIREKCRKLIQSHASSHAAKHAKVPTQP